MASVRTIWLGLPSLLACACVANAQGGVGARKPSITNNSDVFETLELSGRVLFSQQFKPAQRVMVKLVTIGGALISTTYTDERGKFDFPNLTRAVYIIQIEEEGYQPAQERVDLYRGSRGDTVLVLEEKLDATEKPTGTMRTIRELRIPDKAQKEFDRGMAELYEEDQPRRGLVHFQKAIKLHSDFDAAYVQAGIAHLRLGEVAAAESILAQGVEVNPENSPARALLGTAYNSLGRHRDAINMLEQAATLGGPTWQTEYELAKAHAKLEQFDPALVHAKRACEMKPDVAEPHLQLYNVQVHRRDYGEALVLLEAFLERYPQHSAVPSLRRVQPELRAAVAAANNRP